MNRYRITMKEIYMYSYEIDAHNIDCALENSHNWVFMEKNNTETGCIQKIELIKER